MNTSKINHLLSDQAFAEKVSSLPNQIEPKKDLWQGIERAINYTKEPSIKRHYYFAWAATIFIAILLSWQLNFKISNQHIVDQNIPSFSPVELLSNNFIKQKNSLLTSYGKPNLNKLPKTIQDDLIQLEQAQKVIKKALVKDIYNQDLLNLLQWTQQQELKLISQLYQPYWQKI